MVRRRAFRYNVYGRGRTRPMSEGDSHWRDLGVKLGMQMRRPPIDPAHSMPPRLKFRMSKRFRQRKQSMGAFLTPQPC